jgi:hypothetical protein
MLSTENPFSKSLGGLKSGFVNQRVEKNGDFPRQTTTELEEKDKADDVSQLKAQSTHWDVKACRLRGSWHTVISKEVEWGYMGHANRSVSSVRQMSPSHTALHLPMTNLPLSV